MSPLTRLQQDYLRNVARKYNLYKYIRFNTSVEAATWDDAACKWKVDVKVTGGKDSEFSPSYTIETDFLISAVGQLNQPHYPNIEGLDSFKGKVMHSARWDWSYNLQDKNVGIIGNGTASMPFSFTWQRPESLTYPRCHCSSNHSRNPPPDQVPHRLPALPELGHPSG